MWIFYLSILQLTFTQDLRPNYVFSDCKHLILPARCQCYHSGQESQLRCSKSELHFLPKLPNNMRWNALDFSSNYITSVDNYVFADIYVEKIHLNSNYLRRIEVTGFDQIKNLKQLYLNHNQLEKLPPQALISPGSSLEIFDVSHNPFQYLDIGEILLNLPMLKQFHLVSCHLNNTSIYTLLKLLETSADDNNQTIVRPGHYSLEILDLSQNNLTKICQNLFDGLYQLVELRLDHNFIRLIDNNFLHSFQQIKILNLAHNQIEYVPKLASRSLEVLNFSSNHIHFLTDYFASNLPSIRSIDFDSNSHLNTTSFRAFCFLNLHSLEKLSFRSNNLISLNTFAEFLCQLTNHTEKSNLIDINHNINLKCNCTLIEFQNYLNNYNELTCTRYGQDRYYISTSIDWLLNCPMDFCVKREKQLQMHPCNWHEAERAVYEGTCEAKLAASEEKRRNRMKLTTTIRTVIDVRTLENGTEHQNLTNSTRIRTDKIPKSSDSRTIQTNLCSLFILSLIFLLL